MKVAEAISSAVRKELKSRILGLAFESAFLKEMPYATRGRRIWEILDKLAVGLTYQDRGIFHKPDNATCASGHSDRGASARKAPKENAGKERSGGTSRGKIEVNPLVLDRLLARRENVEVIFDIVMGKADSHYGLHLGLQDGKYVCPACGAINEPTFEPRRSPLPEACGGCNYMFLSTDLPEECPPAAQLLGCPRCPLVFRRQQPIHFWPNDKRRAGQCPRCQNVRLPR